jgi:ParB family chromosome partitioning protein
MTTELIANKWTESGVCEDPEIIKPLPEILTTGKKAVACELHLGVCPDGSWRSGWNVKFKDHAELSAVGIADPALPDRLAALKHALQGVVRFFQKEPKIVKALEAFHAQLGMPIEDNQEQGPVIAALPKGKVDEIPVSAIVEDPANARKTFDSEAMRQLAASIRQHGLLQPIAVRRLLPEEVQELPGIIEGMLIERYEVILGNRRHRAHVMLGLETVEAKVYEGVSRKAAKAAALVENLQRVDLNPIEEAEGYRDLMAAEGLTQEQVAARVNRSRPSVANALRVLRLPEDVVQIIREGKLSVAHGVALARFADFPKVVSLLAEVCVRDEVKSARIERGVPYSYELERAGLAVKIPTWQSDFKFPPSLKKHPAYFPTDGEIVCFDPAHWEVEKSKLLAEKKAKEEAERKELEEAATKGAKKKKLKLSQLEYGSYAELDSNSSLSVVKGLKRLVPDVKRQIAVDHGGHETEICLDKKFIEKLTQAAKREMKKDRGEKLPALVEEARKAIGKIKRMGERELAWLFAALMAPSSYVGCGCEFDNEAAERQGIKLPDDLNCREWTDIKGLAALQAANQVDLFRIMLDTKLESAATEVLESGIDGDCDNSGDGGDFLKWILERDSLGFLEESDSGKKEIIERVKNAPWYQRDTADDGKQESAA